jgi:hypothetical protein
MGDDRLELPAVTSWSAKNLRNTTLRGGAESGAVSASGQFDADLAALIEAWPSLPGPVRAGIVAMVNAMCGSLVKGEIESEDGEREQ